MKISLPGKTTAAVGFPRRGMPAVLFRLPERPTASIPLDLHALIERVIK